MHVCHLRRISGRMSHMVTTMVTLTKVMYGTVSFALPCHWNTGNSHQTVAFYDLSKKMPTSIFPLNQSIKFNVLPETGVRWKSQRIILVITFSLVGIVIYQTHISCWSIKIARNYFTKSSPKSVGFLPPSSFLWGQWMSAQNVTPVRLIVEILVSGLIPRTSWPKYGKQICYLWPSVLGCSLLWLRGRARVLLLEGR